MGRGSGALNKGVKSRSPGANARIGSLGWTVAGPSPAEGRFAMAGGFIRGGAYASPTLPGRMMFRFAI